MEHDTVLQFERGPKLEETEDVERLTNKYRRSKLPPERRARLLAFMIRSLGNPKLRSVLQQQWDAKSLHTTKCIVPFQFYNTEWRD